MFSVYSNGIELYNLWTNQRVETYATAPLLQSKTKHSTPLYDRYKTNEVNIEIFSL